ncbi:MAG: methyltransferase domain-containing protein [Prosthecobacter sp.]
MTSKPQTFFPNPWWRRLIQSFRWQSGQKSERAFWDRYLKTRGLRWRDEFERRMSPELELDAELAGLLSAALVAGEPPKIVDVGAGPLSVVGKRMGGMTVQLTALDPLAAEYDKLLKKHGLQPPVRTQLGKAEDVPDLLPKESFDLAHARNCLDHGLDPFFAVVQMLSVVKPGGYVYLKHRPNEGINEDWHGLHQWNFSISAAGDFTISSRNAEMNVNQALVGVAEVRCEMRQESDGEWLVVIIQKKSA